MAPVRMLFLRHPTRVKRITMLDRLPQELLFKILLSLEPKDLIRCMCVSKVWHASIHNQRFIKLHHEHSIKTNSTSCTILLKPRENSFYSKCVMSWPLYDNATFGTAAAQLFQHPNRIQGYSNGLVCIRNLDKTDYYFALWNPSIQRWKKIPSEPLLTQKQSQPQVSYVNKYTPTHYGFGYDSVNDDYKIVRIVEIYKIIYRESRIKDVPTHGEESRVNRVINDLETLVVERFEVSVYSLKSNLWKRIQSMPCNGFGLKQEPPVFLNSALHWTTMDGNGRCTILSLDLASEKYRMFPIPDGVEKVNSLALLGGSLCISYRYWNCACLIHDVWIMKEYGVIESWTLRFSVESVLPSVYNFMTVTPLLFSKNGKMVLLNIDDKQLCWFDLETKCVTRVQLPGPPDIMVGTTWEGVGSLRLLLDGDPVIVGRQSGLSPHHALYKRRKMSKS